MQLAAHRFTFVLAFPDGSPLRDEVAEILQALVSHCQIRHAATSEAVAEALEEVSGKTAQQGAPLPALVVMDVSLREDSGESAAALVKRHPAYRCIPIIGIADGVEEAHVQAGYDAGINAVIAGPFDGSSLRHKIEAMCMFWVRVAHVPDVTLLSLGGPRKPGNVTRRFL